jgi:ornithine cyclodeaminase/alanine dehydrogenase-like protein (mu-crystallin family)
VTELLGALKGAHLSKQALEVLVLSEREVRELLDLRDLLAGLAEGFRALSAGEVNAPERNELAMPAESFLLSMPGVRPGGHMTVKVVTVFEENYEAGLPSHLATIGVYDSRTGACLAFMDGTYITAIRTSASAAVSTRLLAREDANVLTILGAGVQGLNHLRVFPLVRDFGEIRVGSKHYLDAQALAGEHPNARAVEDFEQAVRSSDVVALATHSGEPVIAPEWVRPGTHLTSVGYKPPRGELPRALLERGSLFVETRLAFEPTPVGCAELAGLDGAAATELGEIGLDARPGRRERDEITVYKAMGHVIEDIVAADLVYRRARDQAAGRTVEL